MSTTGQQVFDRAADMSSLNDKDLINPASVLAYVNLYQRKVYLRAARLNPEYFGTTGVSATKSASGDVWNLATAPGNIAAITRVEVAAIEGAVTGVDVGDQVRLIYKRWPDLELPPRAMLRGKILSDYNSELTTDSSNYVSKVTVYYSPLPTSLTALSQTMSLDDEWCDLVTYPLAQILAIRDRRTDEEMQWLDRAYKEYQGLFDEAVMVYDYGVKRALPSVPAIPLDFGQPRPQQGQQ